MKYFSPLATVLIACTNSLLIISLDTKPDVVLTDIEMPDMNGIVAAEQILKKEPDAKIIFLTMHNSDEYIYKILEINASGLKEKYLLIMA